MTLTLETVIKRLHRRHSIMEIARRLEISEVAVRARLDIPKQPRYSYTAAGIAARAAAGARAALKGEKE